MTKAKTSIDLHQKITDKMIAKLEAGVMPWACPWDDGGASMPLRSCGTAYRGINVLTLWIAATERGFQSPHWMTFKQAKDLGASVRKGAKSEQVVYFGKHERDAKDGEIADAEGKTHFVFMKGYNVFNSEQIDGLPERFDVKPGEERDEFECHDAAEEFFDAIPALVTHEGARAFYAPGVDRITMPERNRFNSAIGYYSTRAHETVHWTGNTKRLDRLRHKQFGDRDYAFEELVAEMGAAFTMAHLGLASEPTDESASYIANWLNALKNDKKFIFKAATAATAAVDYMQTKARGGGVAPAKATTKCRVPATRPVPVAPAQLAFAL